MRIPHPIPYQGSKRIIARHILAFFPSNVGTLIEPFVGSAAVSIAAALCGKAARFHLNDINQPLMSLWREILHSPDALADAYEGLWNAQMGREREFYDIVRDEFNRAGRPDRLLYLLARCVKASVRYNDEGAFNQSPDNRRKGRNPHSMRSDLLAVSRLLRSRTRITHHDYRDVLGSVEENDLVYMDPPYEGVCGARDQRYSGSVHRQDFVEVLEGLVDRDVAFILSYDGRCGDQLYGRKLPTRLGLLRIEIEVGRSAQATLLGRSDVTYESVYLSRRVVCRLGAQPRRVVHRSVAEQAQQLLLTL